MSRMSEPQRHSGGCHCGRVRFEASVDLEKPVISCNCSMCGRAGTLLAFVPEADFSLLSGENALTDYLFNHKVIHHFFCKVCGIKPFGRGIGPGGAKTVAINTRCLDDLDLDALKVQKYDGKSS